MVIIFVYWIIIVAKNVWFLIEPLKCLFVIVLTGPEILLAVSVDGSWVDDWANPFIITGFLMFWFLETRNFINTFVVAALFTCSFLKTRHCVDGFLITISLLIQGLFHSSHYSLVWGIHLVWKSLVSQYWQYFLSWLIFTSSLLLLPLLSSVSSSWE